MTITLDRQEIERAIRFHLGMRIDIEEVNKYKLTFYNRDGELWCVECEEQNKTKEPQA